MELVWLVPIIGAATVVFALWLTLNVLRRDSGSSEMQDIAAMIFEGANAFMYRQYRTIAMLSVVTAVVVGAIVGYFDESLKIGVYTGIAFMVGAFASALSGFIGMYVAVRPTCAAPRPPPAACARRSPSPCEAAPSQASRLSP